MSLDLVILAAGRSSRYGAPKMLAPVGPAGECLSDYAVYDALRTGVSWLLYVICREHRSTFEAHHGARLPRGRPVAFAFDGAQRHQAARLLRGVDPFAANARFIETFEDPGRRRLWRIAVEALGEVNRKKMH